MPHSKIETGHFFPLGKKYIGSQRCMEVDYSLANFGSFRDQDNKKSFLSNRESFYKIIIK